VNNQKAEKKVHKKHGKIKGPININEPLLKFRRKMINVIDVRILDISRRIALNVKLGSKRKVSIMFMYVLNQT